jgi:hypothetical protein
LIIEQVATLDKVFAVVKDDICSSLGIKEELDEDVQATDVQATVQPSISCRLDIIAHLARGSSKFDPAQDDGALKEAEWRRIVFRLDVSTLLQTHDEVNLKFRHGPHSGQSVDALVQSLMSGDTCIDDITPLVVIRCFGDWVVFGNRRLKALKASSTSPSRESRSSSPSTQSTSESEDTSEEQRSPEVATQFPRTPTKRCGSLPELSVPKRCRSDQHAWLCGAMCEAGEDIAEGAASSRFDANEDQRARSLLGLHKNGLVTDVILKRAFRDKARECHPDKQPEHLKAWAHKEMVQVIWAYKFLCKRPPQSDRTRRLCLMDS